MSGKIPDRYGTLVEAIERGDAESAVVEAERLVSDGLSLADIYREAMTPSLLEIGDRFSRLEIFLPEMVRSADAVKAIHRALAHTLEADGTLEPRARVVIGTSYGDIHDIGKNIVAAMLEVNGFEVIDLGVGVAAGEFIDRARQADADVIAVSSLMSTSMPYLSDVVGLINANERDRTRFQVIVGGGPVNAEYADRIGADGYADDAAEAVRLIERLLSLSGDAR
jgi:5-methyltetrahydrofolate--homocysteine methyltransferase